MSIAILGYGNIGKYIADEIALLNPDIIDPLYPAMCPEKKDVYDVAFVCVPTEMKPDGSCDTSIVEQSINQVQAQIYIIKSTVPPGTSSRLHSPDKHIVFSPEFYGTTLHSKRTLNFAILGGDVKDCAKVAELYSCIKSASFRCVFTSREAAELTKYMLNCFLATKVTFCNEFAQLAKSLGIEYAEVRELFCLDERVGSSHTYAYPKQPYYNNHCFNKDIPAFIAFCKSRGIEHTIINDVHKINKEMKEKYHA